MYRKDPQYSQTCPQYAIAISQSLSLFHKPFTISSVNIRHPTTHQLINITITIKNIQYLQETFLMGEKELGLSWPPPTHMASPHPQPSQSILKVSPTPPPLLSPSQLSAAPFILHYEVPLPLHPPPSPLHPLLFPPTSLLYFHPNNLYLPLPSPSPRPL
jgi:hypothetical protein